MQNGYTQDTLIQYYYQELNPAENELLEAELQRNLLLREEFNNIVFTLNKLDDLLEKPHPSSVELILEHSASHENFSVL
jgi:hypothetical protein